MVSSMDKELSEPCSLDAYPVTFEQVDEMVRRALELDTSNKSLTKVIEPSDWVIIKLNLVNTPMYDFDGNYYIPIDFH